MSLEFEIVASRLSKAALRVFLGSVGAGLGVDVFDSIVRKESGDVDKRLAKIEAARENLLEALTAIDDIKATAQEHKKELETLQNSVVEIGKERDKLTADKNLLLQMTSAERDRLRDILGVPTRLQSILIWIGTFLFGAVTSWLLTYAYGAKIKGALASEDEELRDQPTRGQFDLRIRNQSLGSRNREVVGSDPIKCTDAPQGCGPTRRAAPRCGSGSRRYAELVNDATLTPKPKLISGFALEASQ